MSYEASQYEQGRVANKRSAHEIVPMLYELLQPKSVIDVGCGEGWWLKEFEALGVKRLVGVENNVDVVATGELMLHDLETPLVLHESFDVCLCLEVAEHLTPERSHGFILDLCHLSDTIIFSAAIPAQGGHNHINEQWPSYWIEKFAEQHYEASDYWRWKFWENPNIETWYSQNILWMARGGAWHNGEPHKVMNVVHPRLWGAHRGLND